MAKKKASARGASKRIPTLAGEPLAAGDVLFRKLPDGWHVAARILHVDPTDSWSTVVATTDFLEQRPPRLDDPALRRTFHETGCEEKVLNGPAVCWIGGGPIKGWTKLGNLPLTAEDKKLAKKCKTFAGGLDGEEAHHEWRWQHQRAECEKEAAAEEARWERERTAGKRKAKPKAMMPEDDFWALVGLIDGTQRGDERQLAPLVAALAARTRTDIKRFAERLAFVSYQLDTRAHGMRLAEPLQDGEDYVSPDAFLYARCWVVAQGRKTYEDVLRHPEKFVEQDCEALLSVAEDAWLEKTGEDFEYTTGLDYESFSNVEGWN